VRITFQQWLGDNLLKFERLSWTPIVAAYHWHSNVYGMGSWQPIGWSSYVVLPRLGGGV
jgi:hypothetical protein